LQGVLLVQERKARRVYNREEGRSREKKQGKEVTTKKVYGCPAVRKWYVLAPN
jgi:hypothetical protein